MAGIETSPRIKNDLDLSVNSPVEIPSTPEVPRLKLNKVAVISGPSYSGKDSVMNILAERHGWPVYDGTIDEFERRGSGSGNLILRKRLAHKEFDAKQAIRFAELKPYDQMWIHQTRLGGIILASEVDKRNELLGNQNWKMQNGEMPLDPVEPIPAVSILLWTSRRAREDRAVKHEQTLAIEENRSIPTRKHILEQMNRKELDDTRSWRKRFGSINFGSNPFSRYLKRKNGQPVYNRFVETDKLTPEQVADKIEQFLIQLGAAEIIIPDLTNVVDTKETKTNFEGIIFNNETIEESRKKVGAPYPQTIEDVENIARTIDEINRNGNTQDVIGAIKSEPTSSMDKDKTNSVKKDRHPHHPSRRNKSDQEIVA